MPYVTMSDMKVLYIIPQEPVTQKAVSQILYYLWPIYIHKYLYKHIHINTELCAFTLTHTYMYRYMATMKNLTVQWLKYMELFFNNIIIYFHSFILRNVVFKLHVLSFFKRAQSCIDLQWMQKIPFLGNIGSTYST